MLKILTVCGNGIGSSLMAKGVVEKICADESIDASVKSADVNSANSADVDLAITVKEIAPMLTNCKNVALIRSYVSERKIREDILETLNKLGGK
ncbi:MAG: PTS sugar transporter subunit IIB [Treponemataceae bacterium]